MSEQIREVELSVTISKLADTFDKETEEEKSISVFLRSLRIHMCLNLIKAGYSSCKTQFYEDWNEIVESLKFIRGEWKVTKELISDAVDIMDLSKRDYLNDQKIFQLLSFLQQHFNVCYGILRTAQNSVVLYETVLRYKDLPSLVGRERNKLLRLTPVDEELSIFIFKERRISR